MIHTMLKDGLGKSAIVRKLKTSRDTVSKSFVVLQKNYHT